MVSEEMREKLNLYGQAHLIGFYGELSAAEKSQLENQLETIDFALMERLFRQTQEQKAEPPAGIEPIPCAVEAAWTTQEKQNYYLRGMEILRDGKYAAVTMAGGQGTRLGHPGPKGTFRICVPEQISLFEVQCRRL